MSAPQIQTISTFDSTINAPQTQRKKQPSIFGKSPKGKNGRSLPSTNFTYLTDDQILELAKDTQVVTNPIRINPKNFAQCFVPQDDPDLPDIKVFGLDARNGALDGDIVTVKLNKDNTAVNSSEDTSDVQRIINSQQSGEVIKIVTPVHHRVCVGKLDFKNQKQSDDKAKNDNKDYHILIPVDTRVPRIVIPNATLPQEILTNPENFKNINFLARLEEWSKLPHATGSLIRPIMKDAESLTSDLDEEHEILLCSNNIDSSPFSDEILELVAKFENYSLTENDRVGRKDYTSNVVFTIDPATARDLDDALSCDKLPCGNFRIAVHIADVSHFLDQVPQLDVIARQRATSTYLVNKAIPMLPHVLSSDTCSLNPGTEKLTFSVEWIMSPDATVLSQTFHKSVINSCSKLSYEAALEILSGDGEALHNLKIANGVTLKQIEERVGWLDDLAKRMRAKRMENGALVLNQVKPHFSLDCETGVPLGYGPYVRSHTHYLIEEFMLQANISVAQTLHTAFADRAVLRKHPSPKALSLAKTRAALQCIDPEIDVSTSKAIAAILDNMDDQTSATHHLCVLMFSKCNQMAEYLRACEAKGPNDLAHYALAVPLYTHFTSPIRRYADVMVHRQLATFLRKQGYLEDNTTSVAPHDDGLGTSTDIDRQLMICNKQKASSKDVGRESTSLYYGAFIRHLGGELLEECICVGIASERIEVMLLKTSFVLNIHPKYQPSVRAFRHIQTGTTYGVVDSMRVFFCTPDEMAAGSEQASILTAEEEEQHLPNHQTRRSVTIRLGDVFKVVVKNKTITSGGQSKLSLAYEGFISHDCWD